MYFHKIAVLSAVMSMVIINEIQAQQDTCNHQVTIIVQDNKQTPIIGAGVSLGSLKSTTDINGSASFDNLCSNIHHLHIIANGNDIIDENVNINNDDTLFFTLEKTRVSLDDIEIFAHRRPLNTAKDVQTISSDELYSKTGETLGNILAVIPGVNTLNTGATISKPMINGLYGNRIIILNNGIRQEGQQWGQEHAPEIDPATADNISVIKGAESIRYGSDAIGGVILLNPAEIPPDTNINGYIGSYFQTNGKGGGGTIVLNGRLHKWPQLGFRVQSSGKKIGNMHTSSYYLENTGMHEMNFSSTIDYHSRHFSSSVFYSRYATTQGILSSAHTGSLDDLLLIIKHGRPFNDGTFNYKINAPKQTAIHHLLKANAHFHWNDFNHINLQYGFQKNNRQEFDKRRSGLTSVPSLYIDIATHTLDAYWSHSNGRHINLQAGINAISQYNESNPATLTIPLIPDFLKVGIGAFYIMKYHLNKFSLETGIRTDAHWLDALGYDKDLNIYGSKKDYYNASVQMTGAWYPNNLITIRSSIGNAFRLPGVNELYSNGLHHGAAQMEYGDSTLQPERSYQINLALDYSSANNKLQVYTAAFINYFSNYIYLMPTMTYYQSLRGAFPEFKYDATRAILYGLNGQLEYKITEQWTYSIKPSWMIAVNKADSFYLPNLPPFQLFQSVSYVKRLNNQFPKVFFKLQSEYVAKQNRISAESDYALPPNPYLLLGLHMGTEVKLNNKSIDFSIRIDNLTNTLYKNYLNRYRYFAHDLGRNIVFRINYTI